VSGQISGNEQGTEALETTASSFLFAASGGAFTLEFRYSPLIAADEKIPLSVVDVNKKPQYLVFS
jgi:hypothetical protein